MNGIHSGWSAIQSTTIKAKSFARTVDFDRNFVIAEIALTTLGTVDIAGDSGPSLNFPNTAKLWISSVTQNGVAQNFPNDPTFNGSPTFGGANVTSVTFKYEKVGFVMMTFRYAVQFWG